jgi:hypothetical protein
MGLPFHFASLGDTKLRLSLDVMEYMNKDHSIKGSILFLILGERALFPVAIPSRLVQTSS